MKLRSEILEEIRRGKIHYPDAFYILKDIEELLNDAIIVPKEMAKIENITFSEKKCEDANIPLYSMTGSLNFSVKIVYGNALNDKSIDNIVKEKLQSGLIEFMESGVKK